MENNLSLKAAALKLRDVTAEEFDKLFQPTKMASNPRKDLGISTQISPYDGIRESKIPKSLETEAQKLIDGQRELLMRLLQFIEFGNAIGFLYEAKQAVCRNGIEQFLFWPP